MKSSNNDGPGGGHTNPGPSAQAQGCAALGETKLIFTYTSELAREYRKAPSVGGLRIGSSFFRTYTVEHSRKGAPVVNIKLGPMRLWIAASIGWVAFVGGMRWRTLPEHIPLWEALIPPIGILGIE